MPIENAPIFVDVMNYIGAAKTLSTNWQKIANLQTQAQVLIFLQKNNISDMESFVDKVTKMSEDLHEVSTEIKKADRRLETLETHLAHCENLRQHKGVNDKYKQLAPKKQSEAPKGLSSLRSADNFAMKREEAKKKQAAYYEKHATEIEAYQDANKYLMAVLNDRTEIPIPTWKKELSQLTAERVSLAERFYNLKDEIKSAEVLRRGMEEMMRGEVQLLQQQKNRGVER